MDNPDTDDSMSDVELDDPNDPDYEPQTSASDGSNIDNWEPFYGVGCTIRYSKPKK